MVEVILVDGSEFSPAPTGRPPKDEFTPFILWVAYGINRFFVALRPP